MVAEKNTTVEVIIPMQMKAAISVTAALLVLFLTPSLAHATPKACDLLSAETAGSLVGSPVGSPTDLKGTSCTYKAAATGMAVQVIVTDAQGTKGTQALSSYKNMAAPGTKPETIAGLGDKNLLVTVKMGQMNNMLMVLYHEKMVALSVEGQMTTELKAAMVQAVKQMIKQI